MMDFRPSKRFLGINIPVLLACGFEVIGKAQRLSLCFVLAKEVQITDLIGRIEFF